MSHHVPLAAVGHSARTRSARTQRSPSLTAFRAFTLVELLVVVAIISLLIAMLLPSLAKARKAALAVRCASGMRQVTLALFNYGSQNNDYLPHVAWRADLVAGGYLPGSADPSDRTPSENFRCPLDEAPRPSNDRYIMRASYVGSIGWKPTTDPNWVPQTPWASLGMFPAHAQAARIRFSDARDPAHTITILENYYYTGYLRYRSDGWQDSTSRTRGWSAYGATSTVHDGQANFAFVDGHGAMLKWTDTHAVGSFNKDGLVGTGQRSLWNRGAQ